MKKLYITDKVFTVENGTLTPTLKIKRFAAKKMYMDVIDNRYAEPLEDTTKNG